MQKIRLILFTMCVIIAFGNCASADDVSLHGTMGMTFATIDFNDKLPIDSVAQAVANLDLKLDWTVNDYLNLYLQVQNDWIYDLHSGAKDAKTRAKKYYLDLSNGLGTSLRVGKQRLSAGSGVFWNPIDFFHPTTGLLQKQGDEDTVESLLVETYLAGNTIALLGLPVLDENYAAGMIVERLSTGYHLEANAFMSQKQKALGVNLETSLAGVDVYSEAALVFKGNQTQINGLLGLSYLIDWEHNASVRAELYHDETGAEKTNNLALGVNYSPTERLNTSCNLFYRLNEKGLMLIPVVKYGLNDYWEVTADGLVTLGKEDSLYGSYIVKNKFTLAFTRFF